MNETEASIYQIIYANRAISEQCIRQRPQFFTLPYMERLKGYIDIIEGVSGKSPLTDGLRLQLDFQKKDRRKLNDPKFFLGTTSHAEEEVPSAHALST